jgi:hypothetical protein
MLAACWEEAGECAALAPSIVSCSVTFGPAPGAFAAPAAANDGAEAVCLPPIRHVNSVRPLDILSFHQWLDGVTKSMGP